MTKLVLEKQNTTNTEETIATGEGINAEDKASQM